MVNENFINTFWSFFQSLLRMYQKISGKLGSENFSLLLWSFQNWKEYFLGH